MSSSSTPFQLAEWLPERTFFTEDPAFNAWEKRLYNEFWTFEKAWEESTLSKRIQWTRRREQDAMRDYKQEWTGLVSVWLENRTSVEQKRDAETARIQNADNKENLVAPASCALCYIFTALPVGYIENLR